METSLLRLSPAVTVVIAMLFSIIFTIVSNITARHREELSQRYVGHVGRTLDDLKLKGKVDFGGEVLHALGREVIPKDTEVKVVDVDGYKYRSRETYKKNNDKKNSEVNFGALAFVCCNYSMNLVFIIL